MLARLEDGPASAGVGGPAVPVLLPVALDQTYDYLPPLDGEVRPGAFVLVPFGAQTRIGLIWDRPPDAAGAAAANKKLKRITQILPDVPPLPSLSLRFAEWVARYTLTPLGMVARMMMGPGSLFEPARPRFGVRLAAAAPSRLSPARKRVLDAVADGQVRAKSSLAAQAHCSTGVIDGLIAAGTLVEVAIPERRMPLPNPEHARVDFAGAQAQAVHAVGATASAEAFSVTLLDGVTGSGKTEVYFEAVAQTLRKGAQALIMLPEIALTSQFMDRFARRFGCMPVEWHSALSGSERARAWRASATGEARVVVGARSALFLPYRELGLIVVDEEHDQGFKQEDRVHYQARDMAIVRASLGKFGIILASATPSIESHVNARTARYRYVELPGRFSGAKLPDIISIDMRKEPPAKGKWLASSLVDAVTETLAQGQQSLLFLNRRGYAPLTLCRSCGHRLECPQCTAWLVEHRYRHRLNCHHCGFALPIPQNCPKCGEADCLVACGPGVERIAEEVAERFPDARVALLSSDLVPSLVEMRQIIGTIESGAIDIVIGTQMVAKGHHFPRLATVGVVDADLGLGTADPRAGERTFQLLHQVTGRAGRVLACGRGLVQTYLPEHPVMQAIISGDRNQFLESEIRQRQTALLPPYGRLAALIVSARDKELAALVARELAHAAPSASRIEVLGPAEAPLAVIRGRHRWRLLVKAPRELDIQGYLRLWLGNLRKLPSDVRLTVDIDPYSFL
ncbi:MAG TPA: primosomal protein N' [Hyphomicrobiaceae bacterium]|nr:primosomal protein N' [Hyphomicrobiaceae bacterium]